MLVARTGGIISAVCTYTVGFCILLKRSVFEDLVWCFVISEFVTCSFISFLWLAHDGKNLSASANNRFKRVEK